MKNKEKYANLIKTISNPCIIEEYYSGENCKEYEGCKGCFGRFLKWLEEEANIEKKQFSANELAIMKSIHKDFNFIARDKDSELYVFVSKPIKIVRAWGNNDESEQSELAIFSHLFSLVQWEDKEPVRIDDYVKR